MRETVLSNCEKAFVDAAVLENLRVDKRQLNEFRDISIIFGESFGSVFCSLGDTKCFAQVSCEVSTPKATRPNEGTLFINVEVGSQNSEASIQINRILERTLRESRCVDLEALCIIAEEKVWNLRVDISVLNQEGNVLDCSCIAAVAALAHFKRPDVTTTGDGEFIIHTPAEKDLIPIVLHHYPICVSYALFGEGKIPVADPTLLEERVSDATLVLAVNAYKELCCIHLAGVSLTSPRLIQQCSEIAAGRAKRVVDFIKSMLEDDQNERNELEEKNKKKARCDGTEETSEKKIRKGIIARLAENINTNLQDAQEIEEIPEDNEEMIVESSDDDVVICGPPTLIDSKTVASEKFSEESESSDDDVVMVVPEVTKPKKRKEEARGGDDSEEDETIVL